MLEVLGQPRAELGTRILSKSMEGCLHELIFPVHLVMVMSIIHPCLQLMAGGILKTAAWL